MEKFLVTERVIKANASKLDEEISKFVVREGYEPYIFAHEETIRLLSAQEGRTLTSATSSLSVPVSMMNNNCLIGKYTGYKFFEDNTKALGEIELR